LTEIIIPDPARRQIAFRDFPSSAGEGLVGPNSAHQPTPCPYPQDRIPLRLYRADGGDVAYESRSTGRFSPGFCPTKQQKRLTS
jgi:hypothetical protein